MKRSQVLCAVAVLALIVATKAGAYYEPTTKPTTTPPACCAAGCCGKPSVATTVAVTTEPSDVYAVLARLEALKVRQKALDREIREAQALLAEKMTDLRERAAKVATPDVAAVPVPAGAVPPPSPKVSYYEPVTTYRMTMVYDEKTGAARQVATPTTKYVLREMDRPVAPPVSDLPQVPMPKVPELTPPSY